MQKYLGVVLQRYSPATRVTFISHQATEAQRSAAFPLDEEIDSAALAEIAALGWIAPRAQLILSGPERRARQTAEALRLSAVVDAELRDCDYGSWGGLGLAEIQEREPEGVVEWLTDPAAAPHGGESVEKLIARVGQWLEAQRDAGHVVAVTHPAVIRAAIVCALDAPLASFWRVDIAPLTVTDLRFNGRAWTVRSSGSGLGV